MARETELKIETICPFDAEGALEAAARECGSHTSLARKVTMRDGAVVYVTLSTAVPFRSEAPALDVVADLLEAAPDMYEALKAFVSYEGAPDFTRWAAIVEQARAALSKASPSSAGEESGL